MLWVVLLPLTVAGQPCRDRFLEPFSSDSIWNTAIGSGAVFTAVDLFKPGSTTCGKLPCQPATSFHNDQEFILMGVPGLDGEKGVPWVHQGDWGSDDHCKVTGEVKSHVPIRKGTPAICDIQIKDTCVDYPQMSKHDWFHDHDFGGPVPSTQAACATRRASWQKSCGGKDTNVQMQFSAGSGGWTSSSDGGRSAANQANNNPMGILLLDNRTLVQMQPAYRCDPNGPLLARFGNDTDGCPQKFPNITDITGDGALGAHGGSGLSGVGGSIRSGELDPEAPPIAHALKIELQHQWYYGEAPLQAASSYNGGRRQYVWPATGSDGGTNKAPGGLYQGKNPNVVPGALLAIPARLAGSVHTKTAVGAKIKQALVDYGAYIVDDTGAGNSVAICMQAEVNAEMRKQYGYAMTYPAGVSPAKSDLGRELYFDLLSVFQNLQAVTNNAPISVGGGGTPLKPPKPPICEQSEKPFVDVLV